jgi:hypothetical protein
MFPDDSQGCFDKYPENKSGPSGCYLPFFVEIIECLLHRFSKPLPEASWIKSEEFLVKSMN